MRSGFVTFEGIDGSGKTTVSRRVSALLKGRGERVFWTSEPTRHWIGDAVRRSIQDHGSPLAETFLFLADRATHEEEIRSRMSSGDLVLCDRYIDSTYAYQGARLEGTVPRPIEFLRRITEPWVLAPDLTLLLRLPVHVALSRISSRPDKISFEDGAFLEKVARNYDRIARSNRFTVIDADQPMDHVVRDCVDAIEYRFGRKSSGGVRRGPSVSHAR